MGLVVVVVVLLLLLVVVVVVVEEAAVVVLVVVVVVVEVVPGGVCGDSCGVAYDDAAAVVTGLGDDACCEQHDGVGRWRRLGHGPSSATFGNRAVGCSRLSVGQG